LAGSFLPPPRNLRVPRDYATIQAAIDAARGDTVPARTYTEAGDRRKKTITLASNHHP
jgi:hypothetical protein